jgi:hypothetical protein
MELPGTQRDKSRFKVKFEQVFDDWARQFHLVPRETVDPVFFSYYSWISDIAFLIIQFWLDNPSQRRALTLPDDLFSFSLENKGEAIPLEDAIISLFQEGEFKSSRPAFYTFSTPSWNPLIEKRNEARERILKQLLTEIEDELNKEERRCQGPLSGCEKVGPKGSIGHFACLVLYQIRQQSSSEIGKKFDLSRQAVEVGTKHAAELIAGPDWVNWLRPPKRPGRPPKED